MLRLAHFGASLRIYYAFLFALTGTELAAFSLGGNFTGAVWLWPVAWFAWGSPEVLVPILFFSLLLSTAVLAFFPWRRSFRVTAAASLFLLMAAKLSFGKLEYAFFGWVMSSILLILVAPDCTSMRDRRWNILCVWAAQSLLLFTYFLSGLWKVRGLLGALWRGERSEFFLDYPNHQLAVAIMQGSERTPGALWLIEHRGWSALLFSLVLGLELSCLWVIFRPRLMRAWGILLICFHAGVAITMDIWFTPALFLCLALLVLIPWRSRVRRS